MVKAPAPDRLAAIEPEDEPLPEVYARDDMQLLVQSPYRLYAYWQHARDPFATLKRAFGAAADVFASVLAGDGSLPADARERVVDWWASALDRDARPRSDLERQGVYQKIRDRMSDELAGHPASASAAYWLAAAARGQGDLQAA